MPRLLIRIGARVVESGRSPPKKMNMNTEFKISYSLVIALFLLGIVIGCLLKNEAANKPKTIAERAEENYQKARTCVIESGDTLGGSGKCEQCWLDHGFPYDIEYVEITQQDKVKALFH